jgi:hypothetical protein
MPVTKLSKRTVDALTPRNRCYIAYDTALKGFGCKVMATGTKTWVVEYRTGAGGRSAPKKRISLGSTAALTADQARKSARDTLAAVRLGMPRLARRRRSLI